MVPDQHARSRVQILLPRDDFETYARSPCHGVVEPSRDGPLANAMLASETEGEGGNDAVGSTKEQAAVGGEEAGVEGGRGDGEVGEGEEGACEAEVEGEEAEEGHEECVHCCGEVVSGLCKLDDKGKACNNSRGVLGGEERV